MKEIAIVGAGAMGREVHLMIQQINKFRPTWDVCGYIDKEDRVGEYVAGVPIIGSLERLERCCSENYIVCISDTSKLMSFGLMILEYGGSLPNLVHPSVFDFSDCVTVGRGNIFSFGFHLTTNIMIGDFNFFNTRVTIGHDSKIGSANIFSPNVQISGSSIIGDQNEFGLGSSLLQDLTVGNSNFVGGHSLVVRDLANCDRVFGAPAISMTI